MWGESAFLSTDTLLPWSSKACGIPFMSPSRFREGKAIDRPAVRAYPDKGTGLLNSRVLSPYPDRLLVSIPLDHGRLHGLRLSIVGPIFEAHGHALGDT